MRSRQLHRAWRERAKASRGDRCPPRKRDAVAFPCGLNAERTSDAMTSRRGTRRRTRTIASDATYPVTGKRIVSVGTARPGASVSHCVRGRGAARCVFPRRRAGSRKQPGSTTAQRCPAVCGALSAKRSLSRIVELVRGSRLVPPPLGAATALCRALSAKRSLCPRRRAWFADSSVHPRRVRRARPWSAKCRRGS